MLESNPVEIIVKQSRFITYKVEVKNTEDVNQYLENIKKEHAKARHICYAYQIGNQVKYYDDGEPHGTAGKPIYRMIEVNHLDNILIVVVRYFGGIKLGAGPLTRAYLNAAKEVLK